ncbi:MAG: hypothetical protein K2O01_04260 [Bacteroidales bacterium]|nr:hypothetical protein [Bacteroidales bacterium]
MKTMFYEKTKRATAWALALLPLLTVCTSCDKDTRQFKGAYSSKTSGSLVLQKAIPSALDTLNLPDTMTVSLTPESGQMRIAEIKDNADYNLLVSLNLLAGDALSFRAKAEDGGIILETTPYERYIQANVSTDVKMTLGIMTGGRGRIYDDVIVFDLDYQGLGLYNGVPYTVIDSRVSCIATLNE